LRFCVRILADGDRQTDERTDGQNHRVTYSITHSSWFKMFCFY